MERNELVKALVVTWIGGYHGQVGENEGSAV